MTADLGRYHVSPQVGELHVTDTLDWTNMRGFASTLDKGEETAGRVFALDCEMCNTTQVRPDRLEQDVVLFIDRFVKLEKLCLLPRATS